MIFWLEGLCILAGVTAVALFAARYAQFLEHRKDVGEKFLNRWLGLDTLRAMGAAEYFWALMSVSVAAGVWVFGLALAQGLLPLNGGLAGLNILEAAFTTVTTAAHTNLQPIAPEKCSALTYLLAICPINMLGGAIGIALWRIIIHAIARKELGNAWASIWRGFLFLLPLELILGVILISQGVSQNPLGNEVSSSAVASFSATSMVSASGTGINSEGFSGKAMNPTAVTDFAFLISLIGISLGLWLAAGKLIGRPVLARRIALGMGLFLTLASAITFFTMPPSPGSAHGEVAQAVWINETTACSNGGVDQTLERYGKVGILPAYFGLAGPLPVATAMGFGPGCLFLSLATALFMAALMIGKAPDFLGFSVRRGEIATVVIAILGPPLAILLAIVAVMTGNGCLELLKTGGPHAMSAIIYYLVSAVQTNGSAYLLNVGTPEMLKIGMVLMIIGRLLVLGPIIAFAGCLALQKDTPALKPSIDPKSWIVVAFFFVAAVVNALLVMAPILLTGPILEAVQ